MFGSPGDEEVGIGTLDLNGSPVVEDPLLSYYYYPKGGSILSDIFGLPLAPVFVKNTTTPPPPPPPPPPPIQLSGGIVITSINPEPGQVWAMVLTLLAVGGFVLRQRLYGK